MTFFPIATVSFHRGIFLLREKLIRYKRACPCFILINHCEMGVLPMNSKKLSIFFGILAVLIVVLVILNSVKPNTVYGKPSDELYPATREILNDPHYNNIIVPDDLDKKLGNQRRLLRLLLCFGLPSLPPDDLAVKAAGR
jgi:hypothetical protein